MSAKRFALLVVFCLCSGCGLTSNTMKNLYNEVWLKTEESRELAQYREIARAAWLKYATCEERSLFNKDYVVGFEEGYVDYLFWGGKQCSPPIALWCYRRGSLSTAEGSQAFRDWYEGFRLGRQSAIVDYGNRQDITLPVAVLPRLPSGPLPPPPPVPVPPCVLGHCNPMPVPSGLPAPGPVLPMPQPLLPTPAVPQDEPLPSPTPITWPIQSTGKWQPLSEVSK